MQTITKNILTGLALVLALQSVSTLEAAETGKTPAEVCYSIRRNRPGLVEISTEVNRLSSSARFYADDNDDNDRFCQVLEALEALTNKETVCDALLDKLTQNQTTGAPDNLIITITYWDDEVVPGYSFVYASLPDTQAYNDNFHSLTRLLAEQAQEDEQFEKKARRCCRQLAHELCAIQ